MNFCHQFVIQERWLQTYLCNDIQCGLLVWEYCCSTVLQVAFKDKQNDHHVVVEVHSCSSIILVFYVLQTLFSRHVARFSYLLLPIPVCVSNCKNKIKQ